MPSDQVFALIDCNSFYASCEHVFRPGLANTPIVVLSNNDGCMEVWGIGRKIIVHLESMGIRTAMDLVKADPRMLRDKFSVVVEKTARELAGTPCLELDEPDPPKQEICCSRMFGKRLTELTPIKQAVATYAGRTAEKLRAQGAVCKGIRVSIRTGMFNPNELHHAQGALVELPYPTNDTLLLTRTATEAVERVFEVGYRYSKTEVCCSIFASLGSSPTTCSPLRSRWRRTG